MSARSCWRSVVEAVLRRARLFVPLLAGASLPDRLRACLGALLGVALAGALSTLVPVAPALKLLLVAPIGASAVLVFAVPASPLAQPWPVIGGNVASAAVGLAAVLVPVPALAAGAAVAGAILAMSLLRCLHPPGGAVALTVVLGTPALAATGALFPLLPVGLNSALLVLAGIAFHRFGRHSYPHRPAAPAPIVPGLHRADIDAALAELGETFDIAREDLDALLQRAEAQAVRRAAR